MLGLPLKVIPKDIKKDRVIKKGFHRYGSLFLFVAFVSF